MTSGLCATNWRKISLHASVRKAALSIALLSFVAYGIAISGASAEPGRPPTADGAASTPPDKLVVGEGSLGYRVSQQNGDFCAVDQGNLHADDPVYLVGGQRLALHWPLCYQAFLRDPQVILAQIRPRGAFLGDRENDSQLHPLWFIAGVYVVAGLVFGALCAQLALHRGLNSTAWFAAGFLFNLFGYFAMLLLPGGKTRSPDRMPGGLRKFHATSSPITCAKCGAEHHPTARRCPDCGLELKPAVESEVTRIGLSESYLKRK